jgi:DNA-binding NtrC family response regulator
MACVTSAAREPALAVLLEELIGATTFDQAAQATLRAVVTIASAAHGESNFATSGRIVRAVVHFRPDDGYRGLSVVETNAGAPTRGSEESRLSSTTAWRWVATTGRPVAVDVNVGRIVLYGAGGVRAGVQPLAAAPGGPEEFNGEDTRLGLIARDVTHLVVLPLRGGRGAVDGMVSVEASCRAAIGTPFVWERCLEGLQLVADVAATHLGRLPLARGKLRPADPLLPVVGPSMSAIVDMLSTFAQQEEPVLITGPTGSGKSRLARWCHERSLRRGKPFEVLDLCAIPEPLQMGELFGWKKGAFTGAARDNPGHVARARGGTLFIDEIDNLSARAQAGLLRILEEQTYRRLGDDGPEQRADVRFVVGTNANLQDAVREKRFREDLYYRINVLPVKLPPLRERPDEIPMWARFMANRRHAGDGAGDVVSVTPQAEMRLVAHGWPGNLRQLDNIVRRAYAVALMDHGGKPPGALVLDEGHFARAMAYEDDTPAAPLIDALLAAANAFVREAERLGPGGLDLELATALKGFVLASATERFEGNRERAFALFGLEKLAKSRNHHKVLRRELSRVEALCRAAGETRPPFVRMLDGCDAAPSEPCDTDIDTAP